MRITELMLTVVILVAFVGIAFAVAPEKTIEFEGGWAGKVIFNGKSHTGKDIKCLECHNKIFQMKKSAAGTYKMVDMIAGKNCGVCHNGKKAFGVLDFAKCEKCHKK